jgi:release factor glutamine methyltransferase
MEQLSPDVWRYEPHTALDGGVEGTTVIERLISQAGERLRPGGWFLMEISPTIVGRVETLVGQEPRLDRRRRLGIGRRRPRRCGITRRICSWRWWTRAGGRLRRRWR